MNKIAIATIAAVGFFHSAGISHAGGEIVASLSGELRSNYPAGSTEDSAMTIQQHIYEGLVSWKENGDVAPMLAETLPTVSDDGLSYTFTLRKGVKFHDGTPLTAQAVVDSWKFLLDKQNNWACRQYFNGTGAVNISDIKATGDLSVVFTLTQPAPELLSQMARADCGETGIMAPAVYGAQKADKPIGTGPFMIERIRKGQDVTLVRFSDYAARTEPMDGYAGKKEALIDKLTFLIIPDPAASYSALLSGSIQVWPQPGTQYAEQLKPAKGIVVKSVPSPSISTFTMQTGKGPLTDPALRRAINSAVDREEMVGAVSQGYAVASASPIPASSPFYGEVERSGFELDPSKLSELTAAATKKPELVITTNKNYTTMYDAGVVLQASLQAAGIDAKLEVLDFATQLQKYYSGDYQMMTWNYSPTLDPALILDRITGSKQAVPSKVWDNPKARELVNKLLQTPVKDRQPVYDDIHRLYLEDAPMVVWASGQATDAYSEKVKGYQTWAGRKARFWGVSVE